MLTRGYQGFLIAIIILLTGCQVSNNGEESTKTADPAPQSEHQFGKKDEPKEGTFPEQEPKEESDDPSDKKDDTSSDGDGTGNQEAPTSEDKVVEDPASTQVIVNKQRQLPANYVPASLVVPSVKFYFSQYMEKKQMRQEAADALEKLFEAANQQEGLDLVAASGYRSYERQKAIYQSNVNTYGKTRADKFSAQPGHSEHQTGLAMDVTVNEVDFKLIQEFGETSEGKWLEENAHQYGFVIRYPKGKSDITGYSYEPWHLRYVGTETAKEIYKQQQTLEEFFGHVPKN